MKRIILALFLLAYCCQHVEAQPANRNAKPQLEQAETKPSPTPVASPQNEIDNKAEAAREAYRKERDGKDDAFRADQARQNEIVANASARMVWITALNAFIAIAYAFFAWRTLKAVDKQATHASQQVAKMQGQLRVMKRQTGLSQKAVMQTARIVKQNEKMVRATQGQLTSMERQESTMHEQLKAAQVAADAAKESAIVARQALHIAERPYLDATAFKVSPIPFEVGMPIIYTARIENTGRTPAYDVWGGIYLTITENEIFDDTGLDYPGFSHPPSRAPIGSGRYQTRHRTTPDLRLTEFDVQRLNDGKLFLYVYGVEFYKDGLTTNIHRLAYCQQYNRLTKRMEVSAFHNSSD